MSAGSVCLQPADSAGVARVTLSHPAKMNALSAAMWQQLRDAVVACGAAAYTTRVVLLEARLLGADEALARGIVHRVVDDASVATEAMASAARIAALSPQAQRINKRTLRQLAEGGPSHAQRHEHFGYADSAEHREGVAAFVEKRLARF